MKVDKSHQVSHTQSSSSTVQPNKVNNNSIWENNQTQSSLNGVIEPTKQGETGDCWVLSTINALSNTTWGAESIKNAIKPDGKGGAEVILWSPEGERLTYKISANDINKAYESNKYSSGDDDMVVFELAMERYFKAFYGRDDNNGANSYEECIVARAITGKDVPISVILYSDNVEETIMEIAKNPDSCACELSFNSIRIGDEFAVFPGHAYSLKRIEENNGEKYVVITNPQDSNREMRLSLQQFKKYIQKITILEQDGKHKNPNITSNEEGQDFLNNAEIKANIQRYICSKNIEKVKAEISKINKDNVAWIIHKQEVWGEEKCPLLKQLDKIAYGWGKGKLKKELIAPILNAVYERAEEIGVDKTLIQSVKDACTAELDAIFYTNMDTIEKEILKLIQKINYHDDMELNKKHEEVL